MNSEKELVENLYEISWEICNKVGGIYSVISSKAKIITQTYKNYVCIGPYTENSKLEFQEKNAPEQYQETFSYLENIGIKPRYGTWLIKGEPQVILLEIQDFAKNADEYKKELWESHKIESLFSSWEFSEPLIFSYATAIMLEHLELTQKINPEKTILQTHEWMTGFTILALKNRHSKIKTVFTTHATILGRSIAGNNQDLYGQLETLNPHEKAKELNVLDKYTAERAAAQSADIFTTVSEITSKEAQYILERKPDILTLNGLDTSLFPSIEETSIKHRKNRKAIREFLEYMIYPYYTINTEHNLAFYFAGRYEFENKGLDILLEALSKLNQELKNVQTERTISMFIFLAMPNLGLKKELLEQKNYYRHIKKVVDSNYSNFSNKLIRTFFSEQKIEIQQILPEEFAKEMQKEVKIFKKQGTPELCTHHMYNEENDKTIKKCHELGLTNKKEDPVKMIIFPAFLNGADGLFNIDFYELVTGCHLGIFPSYYEPWGYTPLESAALGVPAITTDLAGFGKFIEQHQKQENQEEGILIIKRENQTKEQATQQLYETIKKYALSEHEQRVEHKIKAKKLSTLADWNKLAENYKEAYKQATQKK